MTTPRFGVVLPPHLAMLAALGEKTIIDWPDTFHGEPGDRVAVVASDEPPEVGDEAVGRWEYEDGCEVVDVHETGLFLDYSNGYDEWRYYVRGDGPFPLPLGAVVGTVTVDDALPTVRDPEDKSGGFLVENAWGDVHGITSGGHQREWPGQGPLGDFSPGRWGWLLSNPQPPTKRCERCFGIGYVETHHSDGGLLCGGCMGAGRIPADPIPCTGRQGVFTLPDHIAEALRG